MNLQADISWITAELQHVKDPDLVAAFKSLLQYRNKQQEKDWWDELSVDQQKALDRGLEQARNGETISREDIRQRAKDLLKGE